MAVAAKPSTGMCSRPAIQPPPAFLQPTRPHNPRILEALEFHTPRSAGNQARNVATKRRNSLSVQAAIGTMAMTTNRCSSHLSSMSCRVMTSRITDGFVRHIKYAIPHPRIPVAKRLPRSMPPCQSLRRGCLLPATNSTQPDRVSLAQSN